jgi:hypothetical protein
MSKRVFIGVGHGGVDPGAVGYVAEADANLVISLELKKQLEAAGLTVGISRVKDENDDINEEIREANAFRPDLAFEVHNNAGGGNGFEVYVGSNQYSAKSRACAQAVEAEVKAMGQQSRGVKTGTFGWVRLIDAPAVLTEGFFVDNQADAKDFDTVAEQQALGRAYARAVLKYFGISANVSANTTESVQKPAKTEEVFYRVQVGAFHKQDGAAALLSKVKAAGFNNAFKVWVDGLHKIQVGAFSKPANAEAYLKKLKAAGFDGFITTKSGAADPASSKKSLEDVAMEVARGKWGNGIERKNKLEAAGYTTAEYIEIQNIVNRLI